MRNITQYSQTCCVFITTTLNNTILNVTDICGSTLLWASAGSIGFKGSKKSSTYAAQATAEKVGLACLTRKLYRVHVKLKGIGYGKEAAVRGLQNSGLTLTKIEDVTKAPFNGCRPKGRRCV